jgi:serine protease Do
MKHKTKLLIGGTIVVVLAFVAGGLWNGFAIAQQSAGRGPTPLTQEEQENLAHANSLSKAFRAASDRVLPAVVTIRTEIHQEQVMNRGNGQLPDALRNDPFFRRFFEDMPELPQPGPRGGIRQGMGSGVIIDPSGIILTNNHVVRDGDKVVVRLHDGREFEAKDVSADPKTDLAIVRIEGAGELPYAALGNSEAMNIGDWVIAVGAPFRLQESVTAGIISGKSRVIGINDREEYLQTDAAINPGNSGGPLVNLAGEVIGINTAISSTSGGYQGIGFAIPVNLAKWVVKQLEDYGEVKRAYLGVIIQPVDASLARQLGMEKVQGAFVRTLQDDGPAADAGLKVGDVVLEFAGEKVKQPSDLQRAVERSPIGSEQKLKIVRDGKPLTLTVKVAELPKNLSASALEGKSESVELRNLGLSVDDLTKETASQLGLKFTEGALVTKVQSDSMADRAGVEVGDVIVKVGQQSVKNVDELKKALEKLDSASGIVMTVRNSEGSRIVYLEQ